MIRWIKPEDKEILEESLRHDVYHQGMGPEFFYQNGSFTTLYEDVDGPVMAVRGTKSLRVDVQFMNNRAYERNKKALIENFAVTVEQAKKAGFTEITFFTDSPLLKRFCKQTLGFEDVPGDELRYIIG
jgi:hypothetical protein